MNIAFGDVLLGVHDRPFFVYKNYMTKNNNVETITINANIQNYFGALAKVLILLKKDYQEKTYLFDKDEFLSEIIRDLKMYQKHYKIVKK